MDHAGLSSVADRVRRALAEPGDRAGLARAGDALAGLAERAMGGDQAAYASYHALLYSLGDDRDRHTYAARRWLCHAGNEVEERALRRQHADDVQLQAVGLSTDGFRQRLLAAHEQRSGLRHPMSAHLFAGAPDLRAFRVYLQHHWYRSRGFFRELTEFVGGLSLADARGLYANLYDEVGAGEPGRAHPELLQNLLGHFDLRADFTEPPPWTEAQAYLNNRIRCARSGEPAWGLAVLFSLEYGTPSTHGSIYRLLGRLGVPEPLREFHRIHMEGDDLHAEVLLEQILRTVVTDQARATLLISLHHHRALGMRYFDRIWREIQQGEAR